MNQSRLATLVVGVALAITAINVPSQPVDRDPAVFNDALQSMRTGQSYYPAMDQALRRAGIGPVASARAFRSPWLFEVWRQLPGDRAVWFAYLTGVAAALVAASYLVRDPLAVVSPMVVLLGIGLGASMATESWTAPWMMASVAFAVRDREVAAAGTGAIAVLVRELALPVIAGGMLWSVVRRRPLWPWMSALAIIGVSVWFHARSAAPYLYEPGREAPLFGWMVTASSYPRFIGFGIPFSIGLGPLTALAAWIQAWRRGWIPLVGPILAFGFLGLIVERPYWGAIVTPLQVLLATDLVLEMRRPGFSLTRPAEFQLGDTISG